MKDRNTWNLLAEFKRPVLKIIGWNVLANIPRGMFHGLLYFIILRLALPLIEGTPLDFGGLWRLYGWYAAGFAAYLILSMHSLTINFYHAYAISSDLRLILGEKLRRLSLGFFKQNDPGDVTSRMLHDVNKAENIISHNLPDVVSAVIVPVMLGIFLLVLNPLLTAVMLASVLAASVFFFISRAIVAFMGKQHIRAITETSSRILEYSRCIKLLKAYNMTGEGFKKLDDSMRHLKKLSFKTEVYTGIPVQLCLLVLDIGYFAMLFLAVKMCAAGAIQIAELFSFSVLGYYFFAPVKQLGALLVELRYAGMSAKRIGEIINTSELPYREDTKLPALNSISFNDVRFSYNHDEVLKGVSCAIPERSMTALVGLSGSGKTTMTNLIARFWETGQGEISLDGTPIKSLNPDLLLSRMAMVFQDVYLFNDTIGANIRIGKPDASDEEVRAAAGLACCRGFIERLPKGYDTLVSEAGNSLSGGEKQRISIARAILKNAPIVLLDEATASLDPENEADIQHAIENLVQDKTLVVIAHRFKSIQNADQILVVQNGQINETGTHDTLVQAGGLYQRLWEKQQKAGTWKIRADF